MRKGKKTGILFQLLAVALIFVVIFSLVKIVQNSRVLPEQTQSFDSKTIIRNGVEYFPRQDIDVLLLMGIDKYGVVEDSGSYNNDGEADMIMVVVFDHTAGKIRTLNINRDTMANMPILGVGGRQAGTTYGQIALSHTYGSGLEDSCENTVEAVSELLGGLSIDYYVAMHMDAIGIVNDAVGGVEVDVQEDFGTAGVEIPMGKTTLQGQQAIDFVRYRKGVGDQLNISRMQRQMDYVDGFFAALQNARTQDSNMVMNTYEKVSDYIVTNCSSTVLSSMLERCGDYALQGVEALPGENRNGTEHMEFYPDEAALDQLILEQFYAPK